MPTENRSSTEMVSVPREPTEEMIVAFAEVWYSKRQTIDDPDMVDAYKAMLAVAPAEQLQGEPVAWLIDWPEEPELGHYFSDESNPVARSRPLYTHPAPAVQEGELVGVVRESADRGYQVRWTQDGMQALRNGLHLYNQADAGEVDRPRAEVKRLDLLVTQADYNYDEDRANLKRQLAERDAHPVRALGQEAYSTLLGMVEHCLNQRVCMGMDEGFKSFDSEDEHDFVKELRAFLALSASAESQVKS
ncbi:hypothetical protein CSV86_014860 [Pseudomonas putida CSV86]|uniref:Uncharacterized protein n=1 Tax=Pseudomonas bharatica CSV86 TaxID=1005395 RepID=L1M4X3_9PSED|nr:hypothetical protein [Pseudomonas bharatica]NNJ16407.1 hypothetical protein [Pseudomonas bharatica CSV86]